MTVRSELGWRPKTCGALTRIPTAVSMHHSSERAAESGLASSSSVLRRVPDPRATPWLTRHSGSSISTGRGQHGHGVARRVLRPHSRRLSGSGLRVETRLRRGVFWPERDLSTDSARSCLPAVLSVVRCRSGRGDPRDEARSPERCRPPTTQGPRGALGGPEDAGLARSNRPRSRSSAAQMAFAISTWTPSASHRCNAFSRKGPPEYRPLLVG